MPRVSIHPGRELLRCARHPHAWYPRAVGCSTCRMQRKAEQRAEQLTKRAQFDASPASATKIDNGLTVLGESSRNGLTAQDDTVSPASMHELVDGMEQIRCFKNASDAIQEAFFKAMLALALFVSAACGAEDSAPIIPLAMNEAAARVQTHLGALLELQLQELPGLDISQVHFVIVDTLEDAYAHCGAGNQACTHLPSGMIVAPWDLTPSNWPASLATVQWVAEGIAHELCHVYYWQTEGDGDADHLHQECFNRDGDSVVTRVASRFVDDRGATILAGVR
jgi:hypothetical protein